MDSKRVFFIAVIFGISVWSFSKIYHLWKMKNDEYTVQLQRINARRVMDEFYSEEIKKIVWSYLRSERKWLQEKELNDRGADIENKMVKDGYSYAEIGRLRNQVFLKIKADIGQKNKKLK